MKRTVAPARRTRQDRARSRLSRAARGYAEPLEQRLLLAYLVEDILPGPEPTDYQEGPRNLIECNGILFFTADDGEHGRELWRSDGTAEGTFMVKDIRPGVAGSEIGNLAKLNGLVWFRANDGTDGGELWCSDGQPDGAWRALNLAGSAGSWPSNITAINGRLYFSAKLILGDQDKGYEPCWYSPSTYTFSYLGDLAPGSSSSSPSDFTSAAGKLFFVATDSTGTLLWVSDGTTATKAFAGPATVRNPRELVAVGNYLCFSAEDSFGGRELWRSDGTIALQVKDLTPGQGSSNPFELKVMDNVLYFLADHDGDTYKDLFRSDGTTTGTWMVKALHTGPGEIVVVRDRLFIAFSERLWCSDGTSDGTSLIQADASGHPIANMAAVGNLLLFAGKVGPQGYELWRSDGTTDGTYMLSPLAWPHFMTDVNGRAFINGFTTGGGYELWVEDAPLKDDYEENDTKAITDARPKGGVNSPNFGPISSDVAISYLSTLDDANDWYKFSTYATGGAGDKVQIDFDHKLGDLDLIVYKEDGAAVVGSSTSTTNQEVVSLNGQPLGTYYARVYGYYGAANPNYKLTIIVPKIPADRFEANNSFRFSADLGKLGDRMEKNLTIHQAGDVDYYRFEAAGPGATTIKVKSHDPYYAGLALQLLDEMGNPLGTVQSDEGKLNLTLTATLQGGRQYTIFVSGLGGQLVGDYELAIDGPGAEIRGTVYQDLNGNGIKDEGEPGLAGRTVFLDEDQNGLLDDRFEQSTVTDAQGNYVFSNLEFRPYTVAQVQQDGWTQTQPDLQAQLGWGSLLWMLSGGPPAVAKDSAGNAIATWGSTNILPDGSAVDIAEFVIHARRYDVQTGWSPEHVVVSKNMTQDSMSAINLNFTGDSRGAALAPTDSAGLSYGVYPLSGGNAYSNYNWNNLVGASGANQPLVNSLGWATGVQVSYQSAAGTWGLPDTSSGTNQAGGQNPLMMKGYLDADERGSTVTLSGLSGLGSRYQVVIYFDGDNGQEWRVGQYTITDSATAQVLFRGEGEDSEGVNFNAGGGASGNENPNGLFQIPVAGGTANQMWPVSGGNTLEGNVLHSGILSADSITITALPLRTAGAARAPINGIQIIPIFEWPMSPTVAMDGDGNAIVAWMNRIWCLGAPLSSTTIEGFSSLTEIRACYYDAADGWDSGWSDDRILTTTLTGMGPGPDVAMNDAGNAVVVWANEGEADIFASCYDARLGWKKGWSADRLVNTTREGDQGSPRVAMDDVGNAIVVWESRENGSEEIRASRYDVTGGWGPDRIINSTMEDDRRSPDVAMDSVGNAIVVWDSYEHANYDIRATHYVSARGWENGWGADFIVNTTRDGRQYGATVAMDDAGNAIVAWTSPVWFLGMNISDEIRACRYSVKTGWGEDHRVYGALSGANFGAAVAMDNDGDAIVVGMNHLMAVFARILSGQVPGLYTVDTTHGSVSGVDFGNVPPATISGIVWNDADKDGVRDPGEAGLEGWTVGIATSAGLMDYYTETRTTDANGYFEFSGFPMAEYLVAPVLPENWEWSEPETGSTRVTLAGWDFTGNFGAYRTPQAPYSTGPFAVPGRFEAEHYDVGGPDVAYSDQEPENLGTNAFRAGEGVDLQPCSDTGGGYNVCYVRAGEWIEYTIDVAQSGMYQIEIRWAAALDNIAPKHAYFHIEFNGQDKTGPLHTENTGGWQTWETFTTPHVWLGAGVQVMRIVFEEGTTGININWFNFIGPQNRYRNHGAIGLIQAEDFDTGGQGIAYFDNDDGINHGGAGDRFDSTTNGVDIEPTSDVGGGCNVGWFGAGEWLEYTYFVETEGYYSFEFRGATPTLTVLEYYIETGLGSHVTDTWSVYPTGGWQNWQNLFYVVMPIKPGLHVLRVSVLSGELNLNWIRLRAAWQPFNGDPFTAPGMIQAEEYDSGGNGLSYEDDSPGNFPDDLYRQGDDVDIEGCGDVGATYNIGYIRAGERLDYRIQIPPGNVTYDLEFRVAHFDGPGGTFHVEAADPVNIPVDVTGPIYVPDTGDWQVYQTVLKESVTLGSGEKRLSVVFDTADANGYVGNLNWIRVTPHHTPYTGTTITVPARIEAENFDWGANGVAYNDGDTLNNGWGGYRSWQDVDIRPVIEGEQGQYQVGWTVPGEWLDYSINVPVAGLYDIDLRVACAGVGGKLRLEFRRGLSSRITGWIDVPDTGGWDSWQTITWPVMWLDAGPQVLRVHFDQVGPSGAIGDLNWIQIRNSPDEFRFTSGLYSVDETAGGITITVERIGGLAERTSVFFRTEEITAAQGSDFTAASGKLDFAPGEQSKTFTVPILDDQTAEADETIRLVLYDASAGSSLGVPSTATLTIRDNDLPAITIEDASWAEGDSGETLALVTVRLSSASAKVVTVQLASENDTAAAPDDYIALPLTTLTFDPGQTSQKVELRLRGDTLYEFFETFRLNLSNAANATIARGQATATIENDDEMPTLSIDDPPAIIEGHSGTKAMVFTVRLSAASGTWAVGTCITGGGTATPGEDYIAIPVTVLEFAPGQTEKTITVLINGDQMDEDDEFFFVNIETTINAYAGTAGKVTISDDDTAGVTVSPTSGLVTTEAGGRAQFFVVLTSQPTADVTIALHSSNRAEGTLDREQLIFTSTNWNLAQTVIITGVDDQILDGDAAYRIDTAEAVSADPKYNGMEAADVAVVNRDDDSAGTVQFASSAFHVSEQAGHATIELLRTGSLAGGVRVRYATGDGNATDGADYTAVSGWITFEVNQTTASFLVPILDDAEFEGDESLALTLQDPQGVLLDTAVLTIEDPDPVPGTSGPDQYHLQLAPGGTHIQIFVTNPAASGAAAAPSGTPTYTIALANLQRLVFASGAGDDTLTIDPGNGWPAPSGGLLFDAGPDNDRLTLVAVLPIPIPEPIYDGGQGTDTLEVIAGPQDDQFSLGGTTFSWAQLNVRLASIDQIHIQAGDGNDSLSLAGSLDHLNPNITFLGQAGDDSLTLLGALSATMPDPLFDGGEGFDTLHAIATSTSDAFERIAAGLSCGATTLLCTAVDRLRFQCLHPPDVFRISQGAVSFDAPMTLNTLELLGGQLDLAPGGGNSLKVNHLVLSGDAVLNLADNALIVSNSSLDSIDQAIRYRRLMSGTDPRKTLAAILNDRGDGKTPILSEFSGRDITITDILVKYTYQGDTNLDGIVNADDYFQIDSGYISQAVVNYWWAGDLNHDGIVNADDYFIIDSIFLMQDPANPVHRIEVLHHDPIWDSAYMSTSEAGRTDVLNVFLTSKPSADVTIGLSSGNTTEGTVSPSVLSFTPANWSIPQTVTVQGMDDFFADGSVTYPIILAPAISDDWIFNGFDCPDLTATNLDNEAPGASPLPAPVADPADRRCFNADALVSGEDDLADAALTDLNNNRAVALRRDRNTRPTVLAELFCTGPVL